ncbi:hypothetical protein TNIN_386721 [Trichonephila inaurata madagascariensis]|uniref:Uncharacterized protein n=1 Tax=Trichonephila inaurata madagascariensis TaxID=2747483 RepID=A0A8X6XEJ6_9ARAC|nr:hypothetical protein TNIN_386721 [Trichonephila inaurata madagascariensis]
MALLGMFVCIPVWWKNILQLHNVMSYVPISVVLKLSCVGSVQRATDPVVIWRQAKHDNKEADEIMAHMMRRSSTMSTVLT